MRTRDDIEMYLQRAAQPYREIAEGTWAVEDASQPGERVVIRIEDELVVFRLKIVDLPRVTDRAGLFETLLALNGKDLLHGAYGTLDDAVYLTCTLHLENLDYNELAGTLDDFFLAVARHRSGIARFCAQNPAHARV